MTLQIQTPEPERTPNSISAWIYGIVADILLVLPPFQQAEYGKTSSKRKRMLSLAWPTWVRQKANISQPSSTNYSFQRLSTHVNFCNAYTPIPWLNPCCEEKERKTAESFTAWLVCPLLNSWCAVRAAVMVIHSWALSTHSVLMKTGFNFANPATQHQSVPQVPPQNPKGHHYRTCSAEGNARPQSLPHCARKGHKTTHQARRHEKHNNFPRCHLFLQPRSPTHHISQVTVRK